MEKARMCYKAALVLLEMMTAFLIMDKENKNQNILSCVILNWTSTCIAYWNPVNTERCRRSEGRDGDNIDKALETLKKDRQQSNNPAVASNIRETEAFVKIFSRKKNF